MTNVYGAATQVFCKGKKAHKDASLHTSAIYHSVNDEVTHAINIWFAAKYWQGISRIAVMLDIGSVIFMGAVNMAWQDDFDEDHPSSISSDSDWTPRSEREPRVAVRPPSNYRARQKFQANGFAFLGDHKAAVGIAKMDSLVASSTDAAMFSDWLEEHSLSLRAKQIRQEWRL